MIPRIDAVSLRDGDPLTLDALRVAAHEVGFLTLTGTALDAARVNQVIGAYRGFFRLPEADKRVWTCRGPGRTAAGARRRVSRSIPRPTPITSRSMIAGSSFPPGIRCGPRGCRFMPTISGPISRRVFVR